MIGETITLASAGGYELRLDAYIPQVSAEIDPAPRRRAVVVLPGGGYRYLSEREGEPIALAFAAAGFNAFVAHYRVAPARFPTPLYDAAAAVAHVRANAEALHTDPDRIAVVGFSAGGHLAGSLGARWQDADLLAAASLTPEMARPNALVLGYPVITGGVYAHRDSFRALTGEEGMDAHERHSLEHLVSRDWPPTFLWHTFEDGSVPVQNSLLLASALADCRVPFEMHVYPRGGHGMALCDARTSGTRCPQQTNEYNASWLLLASHFLSTY